MTFYANSEKTFLRSSLQFVILQIQGKTQNDNFHEKTPIFDPFFRIVSRVDWQDLLFIPTASKSSESCKKCEFTDAAQCLKITLKSLI